MGLRITTAGEFSTNFTWASHGSPSRRAVSLPPLLLCLVTMGGCARGETLPPVTAGEPPPARAADASEDPVRSELRRLHIACDARREALIDDVDDARRRVRRVSGVAAVAWFLGEVLSGDDAAVGGSDPTTARCDPAGGGGAGQAECTPRAPTVVAGGQQHNPAGQERRSVELDAAAQIRAINRATDDIDTLLFSSPDPAAWTEAEQERWEQLHEVLLQLCD